MILSLLQVVVATLFSQGVWFGLLLVATCCWASPRWRCCCCIASGNCTAADALERVVRAKPRDRGGMAGAVGPRGFRGKRPAACVRGPSIPEPPIVDPKTGGCGRGQRGPGRRAAMAAGRAAGRLCQPAGRKLSGGRAGRSVPAAGTHGSGTLALTLLLFFAVPRSGQLPWRGPIVNPEPLVGFSDKVTLGELGQIIESRDEVMRVEFYDALNDAPQPVRGEIYLQGALLMKYNFGQWRAGTPAINVGSECPEPTRRLPDTGLVRQRIRIGGLDRNELFYVAPFIPLKSNAAISFDLATQRMSRPNYLRNREFEYELGTTAIVNGYQQPLVPAHESDSVPNALTMPPANGPAPCPTSWLWQSVG